MQSFISHNNQVHVHSSSPTVVGRIEVAQLVWCVQDVASFFSQSHLLSLFSLDSSCLSVHLLETTLKV